MNKRAAGKSYPHAHRMTQTAGPKTGILKKNKKKLRFLVEKLSG